MSASEPGALCYQNEDGTWDDRLLHEELLGESLSIDPRVQVVIDREVRDALDYDPNQPRVPKGSGDPSGQWAGRLEEPTPGSLHRQRVRAMKEEEAGREAYEKRYAELFEQEKKRVQNLPAFAESRAPGESDKHFAKRVIDKRDPPDRLPEDYDANFNMKPDTRVVPIEKIISSKSAEETITSAPNAAKRMAAAANGELSKRDPISVRPLPDDTYKVLDGNSTYAAARHYGWRGLPVQIVLKDGIHFGNLDHIRDVAMAVDFILRFMRENDVPITRDAYIALNWPDLRDGEWDSELEDELPEFLQDWSLFEGRDGELVYKPNETYDYNKEHYPAGTPGSKGGQFAPKGGAGVGTKFITNVVDPSGEAEKIREIRDSLKPEDIEVHMAMDPKKKPRHPVNTEKEVYDRSRAELGDSIDEINDVAFATRGEARFPPPSNKPEDAGNGILKGLKRAREKVAEDYGGDFSYLADVTRSTVAYDTVENARYGAEAFIRGLGGSEDDGGRIIRVKDRFVDVDKFGYRDILVNYRTKGGMVAEVMFNTEGIDDAKQGRGHKILEVLTREAKPPAEDRIKLEKESVKLYDNFYERGGNANNTSSGRWGIGQRKWRSAR